MTSKRYIHERVEAAFETMCDQPEANTPVEKYGEASPVLRKWTAELAKDPDNIVLEDWPREPPTHVAVNQVHLETPEELMEAYGHLYTILGERGGFDKKKIGTIVEHENQHADTARNVGFRAIRFSFVVQKVIKVPHTNEMDVVVFPTISHFDYAHPHRPLTKLGLACIGVGVGEPSSGDKANIRAIGYKDAHDVAQRIETHNAEYPSRFHLPLPPFYS